LVHEESPSFALQPGQSPCSERFCLRFSSFDAMACGATPDAGIAGPFIALCVLIILTAVVLLVLGLVGKLRVPLTKSVGLLLVGIMVTAGFRLISLALYLNFSWFTTGIPAIVFQHFSWITFFLTYLLLVFTWIETVHSKYPPPSDRFRPVFVWSMVVVGVVFSALQLGLFVPYVTGAFQNDDAAVWAYVAFTILLTLAFLVYGILLLRQVHALQNSVILDQSKVQRQRQVYLKIILVMSVMAACCLLRMAIFLVKPIGRASGACVPLAPFWICGFMIPEVVPAILEFYVIITTAWAKRDRKVGTDTTDTYESKKSPRSFSVASGSSEEAPKSPRKYNSDLQDGNVPLLPAGSN